MYKLSAIQQLVSNQQKDHRRLLKYLCLLSRHQQRWLYTFFINRTFGVQNKASSKTKLKQENEILTQPTLVHKSVLAKDYNHYNGRHYYFIEDIYPKKVGKANLAEVDFL